MNTIEWTFQLRFLVALALGFLIGLERESNKSTHKVLILGGIRTFPIISMLGFGCAWLFQLGVSSMLPLGLLSICALASISYFSKIQTDRWGVTSEVSALLTFVVGALALLVDIWAAMALGIINTMLLSEKAGLENLVEKLDRSEFTAVLKFLLVTLIILPVLPNKSFTQFELNPSKIWQIVILVSSIGFVGYLLSKFLGPKIGLWLSGFVGGIVSSTAVCIAYGRMAQNNPNKGGSALQGTLVASGVMYLKVLILIFILNPTVVFSIWWKLILLSIIGFCISVIKIDLSKEVKSSEKDLQQLQNPFEVRPAMIFAILFVFLSIITKLVQQYIGANGLLSLAGIVGLSNIDPFILSLIQSSNINIALISSAIIIAMMSNTIIKGIYFGYFVPSYRLMTLKRFGILTLAHIPFLFIR
ncbi:MAG: MgtC/SapB family protein [Ignavibacteriales bacterium]|nr:MgtC/SapB family protein [Ignavibacteriales bacterium]